MSIPFALQLYTVRDALEANLEGALAEIKAMGYDYVELAGPHGLSHEAYKAALDAVELTPMATHFDYAALVADPEAAIDVAGIYGVSWVVVPWVGGEDYGEKAAWVDAAKKMDQVGAKLRAAGCRLAYHNHAHEFEQFDGEYILDIMMQTAAPENLSMELDGCWCHIGGEEVPGYLQRYSGRVPLLHVKDHTLDTPPKFKELGEGCMDWLTALAAAAEHGVEWCIVEQDTDFAENCLESARIGAQAMQRWTQA